MFFRIFLFIVLVLVMLTLLLKGYLSSGEEGQNPAVKSSKIQKMKEDLTQTVFGDKKIPKKELIHYVEPQHNASDLLSETYEALPAGAVEEVIEQNANIESTNATVVKPEIPSLEKIAKKSATTSTQVFTEDHIEKEEEPSRIVEMFEQVKGGISKTLGMVSLSDEPEEKNLEKETDKNVSISVSDTPAPVNLKKQVVPQSVADAAIKQKRPTIENMLMGHTKSVWSMAYSRDGKYIASAGKDNFVNLWDAQTAKLLQVFKTEKTNIFAVAFSHDSELIAAAGHDKVIKIWNIDGTLKIELKGHKHSIWSVAFSPDGKTLASADNGGVIKIWNYQDATLLKTIDAHKRGIYKVAYSKDHKYLVSCSHDKSIKIWNDGDYDLDKTINLKYPVFSVAFSPDGKKLVSGDANADVILWDVTRGTLIETLGGHQGYVWSVSYHPDGKHVISGSYDDTIKVWDIKAKKLLYTLEGHSDDINIVDFSDDGKSFVSGGDDNAAYVWSFNL